MRRGLIILGVLVVAALATLFVAPILIDWDRYRGAIEEEASRLAGREVRIGGKINVRLLPVPYIHIGRLRVADTTAAIGEPLFKADSLTMWLALSPLLGGAIEARRVELDGPVVNLVLDENGSGNWASLTRLAGAGAALPGSIALDDVSIANGSLVLRAPGGAIRAQFQEVAGTVSALALEGPYRVNLSYVQPDPKVVARDAKVADSARRELRLSTARQDADGAVRFKGTVKALTGGMSWAVDGAAHDLLGRVRLEGAVTARMPFVKSEPAPTRGWTTPAPTVVEVKSTLRANTDSMELPDLTLTIDADNKPQLASGAAKFSWRGQTTAEILLKARWIDVDRIIGTDASTASTATLARIIAGLGDALPDTEQLRALVLLDQATLNGDVISGLKADIQKGAGGYEVRELSGNLPGSARLILSGKLIPGGADTRFEGPVTLRGASFNRFVAWAGRGLQPPEISQDGPFALDTQLTVGPTRIGGQDIRLELPGGRLGGDASWTWPATVPAAAPAGGPGTAAANAAAPTVVLALDGPSLDIGALLPNEPKPGTLVREMIALIAQPAANQPTSGAKPSDAKIPSDKATPGWPSADIKLRFGRLATRSVVYHDVDAELRWDGKSWHVPRLRAAGAAGWRVELEGDLAGIDGADTSGTIAGLVVSPNSAALTDFLSLLDIPATGVLDPQRLGRISPLRLAGRLQLSPKTGAPAGGARLTLDGTIGESRVAATFSTPRRAGALHDQPMEVDVRADVPALTSLLAQIAPDGWTAPPSARIAMPARLTFTAVGQLSDGFQTLAALESAGLRGELRGRLRAPQGANPELAGTLQLRADDLAHLLAATALGRNERLAGVPVVGRIGVSFANQRLKLETDDLALADARLRGSVDVDASKPVKRIEVKLASNRADLSRILVPILDERLGAAVQAPARVEPASWWPEAPFDLDRLGGLEGTITLDAAEFQVASGVALRNARLETAIRPGALDIRLVDANASGGKATGRFALAKAPAGVSLKGSLRIDGAEIASATAPGARPSPVAGRVQLILDVAGTALTGRGLIAALSGSGEIRLSDAILNHLSPTAITDASEAILAPGGTLEPGQLEKQLRSRLGTDPIALGRRRIAITVADGHVRTAPIIAETRSGRVSGTTVIDLDSQRIDSEWKLDGATAAARKGAKPRGALPGVTIVWAGPLAQLASIEPQLQFDALERELSVRRMEGEVDELERLRRIDENRARLEADRQRLIESERARDAERALEAQRLREAGSPPPAQVLPIPAPGTAAPAAGPTPVPQGGAAESGLTADQAKEGAVQPGPAPAGGTGEPQATAPPPPPRPPASRPTRTKRPFNPFSDTYSQ